MANDKKIVKAEEVNKTVTVYSTGKLGKNPSNTKKGTELNVNPKIAEHLIKVGAATKEKQSSKE